MKTSTTDQWEWDQCVFHRIPLVNMFSIFPTGEYCDEFIIVVFNEPLVWSETSHKNFNPMTQLILFMNDSFDSGWFGSWDDSMTQLFGFTVLNFEKQVESCPVHHIKQPSEDYVNSVFAHNDHIRSTLICNCTWLWVSVHVSTPYLEYHNTRWRLLSNVCRLRVDSMLLPH